MSRETSGHQKEFMRQRSSDQTNEDGPIYECIVDVEAPDTIVDLEGDFTELSLENNADENTESYQPEAAIEIEEAAGITTASGVAQGGADLEGAVGKEEPAQILPAMTPRHELVDIKYILVKFKGDLVRMVMSRWFPEYNNNSTVMSVVESIIDAIFQLDIHSNWIFYVINLCFIVLYVYLKCIETLELVYRILNSQ
ncbi:hypothetical protein O0L34_g10118 [Tuta absoluta]|nr:hypothetical protein O0L34_g10118 [Tuta absoluta]